MDHILLNPDTISQNTTVVNVEGALKSEYVINHRPMYRMAAQAVSQVSLHYGLV